MEERKPRKYQSLTVEFKRNLLKAIEENPMKKKSLIAQEFGIPPTTLLTIYRNKEKYKEEYGLSNSRKRAKFSEYWQVEYLVLQWMRECVQSDVRVGGRELREKAQEIALQLGHYNFRASNGWIHNVKKRNEIAFRTEPSGGAGPSKKRVSIAASCKSSTSGEKKQKMWRKQMLKSSHDYDNESGAEDDPQQKDQFEMIDIVETRIKEEIVEPEDSKEMSNINNLADDKVFRDSNNFETVYCTPDPIKMEYEDDEPTDTETAVPECLPRIKQEPRDEFEEPEIEEMQGGAKLMWRCPIVTCPEMFSAEVEMYQHLNLNHAVKGPALPSKSRKIPVSSPLITTGLLLFATPEPSNSCGPITNTTASLVTTVVSSTASSVPVVSSSSGPVVVTTTVTTTCAPLVTTSVSSATLVSCVPVASTTAPVTSPSLSVPAVLSAAPDDATSTPTTASTEVPSARLCETGSSNLGTHFLVSPPAKVSSHARQNINITKINAQDSDVSAVEPAFLPKKKHKDLANSQGAHIFNPTEPTLDDLPPCATDDTEMFSISLARFPQNRRVPIKQKLINVVDCIKQKNISADNILIAYYENSCDSRTM